MRAPLLLPLTAALALILASCTSEDPATGTPSATQDAAVTSDDGLEGGPGVNGWLCQYVSPSATAAAAGGTAVTPRERIVQDDEDSWVCEVLTGGAGEQEPVIRLSILLGEEAREQARQRAEAADGVEPGPDYLGLSFVSPGLVTGLTSCTEPGAENRSQQVPYSLVGEALGVVDDETTEDLRSALTTAARNLDQAVGCTPSQAIADMDGGSATTAP